MKKQRESSTRHFDYEALNSYHKIAKELGVSHQTVRKIEAKALAKIRKALAQRGINEVAVDELIADT